MSAVSLCTIFGKTDLVPVTIITLDCSVELLLLLSLPASSSAMVPMDTNGGFEMIALSVLNTAESPTNFFTVGVLISGAIALSANNLGRFPCGIVLPPLSNSDESDEEENNLSFLLCFSFEDLAVLSVGNTKAMLVSSSSSVLSLSSISPSGCLT